MSQSKLEDELDATPEPLLPIEKKLIGWSLGVGLTLLIILGLLNHFIPVQI